MERTGAARQTGQEILYERAVFTRDMPQEEKRFLMNIKHYDRVSCDLTEQRIITGRKFQLKNTL